MKNIKTQIKNIGMKKPPRSKMTKKDRIIDASVAIQSENVRDAHSLGHGAKCLIQASLPYRKPRPRQLTNGCWINKNGHCTIWVQGDPHLGIPYGSFPRLFAIFLASQVIKNKKSQSRAIQLGANYKAFCDYLKIDPSRGKNGSGRLMIQQIDRFLAARIGFSREDNNSATKERVDIARKHSLFWNNDSSDKSLRKGTIVLSEAFYEELLNNAIPVDMRAICALKQSALALDIYQWLAYRMFALSKGHERALKLITWGQLREQFGSNYKTTKHFKIEFVGQLRAVKAVYPTANIYTDERGLLIKKSPLPVPEKTGQSKEKNDFMDTARGANNPVDNSK